MTDTGKSAQLGAILWIGRMVFGRGYRVREVELARRVAARVPVFAVDHTEEFSGLRPTVGAKLRMRVRLMRSPFEVLESGELTRFRMPVAAATGPTLAAAAAAWNERRLGDALARFNCGRVYLSTPFFYMPARERDYRLHFDVIDNFHDQWPDDRVGRARREFHREVLRRADSVSASSLQLCDYVKRLADREAVYVPNAADMPSLKAVTREQAEALRAKLGLQGRFVIGFIGNHTMPFYGLERIVRAMAEARKARPELALLVVGPDGERAKEFATRDDVIVTGAVEPADVGVYFAACDAGVHPYDLRPQTHDAMALNVLEFSVCGKPVLANPLREFQRLALPNVRFTRDDSVPAWVDALQDHSSFAEFDRPLLERRIAEFDWELSADKLLRAMGGGDAP